MPAAFDLPARFVPENYAGTSFDTTQSFVTGNGIMVERDNRVSRAELLACKARYEAGVRPPLFGPGLVEQEFGAERA